MSATPIEVRDLRFAYERKAVLDGVSLRVPQGSLCAIVGKNGCGKSTLLKLIAGILAPPRGVIATLGLDPRRHGPRIRARIGYVADSLEAPAWMRVKDYFRFIAPFHPSWDAAEEARLRAQADLDPQARITTLSRGVKARLALVAALAHRPELLLLDEPFAGFDASVRADVLDALLAHDATRSRTIVFVSHSTADVERLADRVVVLDHGKVAFHGETEELRRRFARVIVRLCHVDARFEPPPGVLCERAGDTVALRYRDFDERAEAWLAHHELVTSFEVRRRALDEVVRACIEAPKSEVPSCVGS
jgi:ABC-2 type transport system ATP-binding protein